MTSIMRDVGVFVREVATDPVKGAERIEKNLNKMRQAERIEIALTSLALGVLLGLAVAGTGPVGGLVAFLTAGSIAAFRAYNVGGGDSMQDRVRGWFHRFAVGDS